MSTRTLTVVAASALALAASSSAQDADGPAGFPGLTADRAPRVEIAWNRLYDLPDLYAHFDRLAAAWPELVTMEVLGHSHMGNEIRLYTINDPTTGADVDKPAMWIDGNVHGNEVQASEVVLYAAWYLLENDGSNERVTELLDGCAFYLVPTVNPDGRAHWFQNANSASSSRSGVAPIDSDRDGVADEDPANDLDGDGNITRMRKYVPGAGTHRLHPDDDRVLEYVGLDPPEGPGDWLSLGSEGIDDDGDGRFNEDGLGGYDMNRAWPAGWEPGHVQSGAGPYPLYWPETRCVAEFLYDHPNVAGVQSFHNSGGMILRGPGTSTYGSYPGADVRVLDELGADGEKMLPFYDYMVIWEDLYTVFGGFVTWTYEGLGILSFTNELWTSSNSSPDGRLGNSSADRHFFDDTLLMGGGFVDWHPYDHPFYGEIEIGGFAKDVGRVPPSFLLEEELHRNALFCLHHARAMPRVVIEDPVVTALEGAEGLWAVDVVFRNENAIPTRTALAAQEGIGRPDRFELEGDGVRVLAGGWRMDRWRPERIDLADDEPERLLRESGIGSRGRVEVRWIVSGSGEFEVRWSGEKAIDASVNGTLE